MRKTTVTMVDDLDGTEGDGIREVRFSLDGEDYTIDLGAENVELLRGALAPFTAVARAVRDGRAGKPARQGKTVRVVRAGGTGADPATIRAWAAANGIEVAPRGRLNAKVVEQYHAANAG